MWDSNPIEIIGATERNVAPIITGKRAPNFQTPRHWISVTIPAANRLELMSVTVCDGGSCSVCDTINGTAISPAYMTRTC
jgi:hypothetical protein